MKPREEAILDALEGAGSLELTPEERAEVREFEAVLDGTRRGVVDTEWSSLREGALVGRVLARTTREDLSWRGDLQLVTTFVRERLASSPVLKLVAASLLVHLIALPVLGWYVLSEPKPQAKIYIGPPLETEDSAFLDEAEPAPPIETSPEERLAERIENARRRARFILKSGDPGAALAARSVAPDAPLEIRLLALRSAELGGAAANTDEWGIGGDDQERFTGAERLQRVLWIDLLLDRNVRSGERSPLLGGALNELAARADSAVPEGLEALRALESMTLDRARSYGLWEAGAGFDPLAVPPPLSSSWCERVGAALAERGLEAPAVIAALRAGGSS